MKTAVLVATIDSRPTGRGKNDGFTEVLYRRQDERYFLHVFGESRSKYANVVKGKMVPGENILPLKYNEAKNWGRKNMSREDFNMEFKEKDLRRGNTFTFYLSNRAHRQLKRYANKRGVSMSALIEEYALGLGR